MFNAIAVMSEKDILAIHGVVSNELKAQIEKAYPHLFKEVFDFSHVANFLDKLDLPFIVGRGLVSNKDEYKSIVAYSRYKVELDTSPCGCNTVIRFIEK
jgi:hypothetical protein